MSEQKAPHYAPDGDHIGVRELRDHLSRYIEQAKAGQGLVITEHGRPVARLVPMEGRSRLEELIAAGIVTPAADPKTPIDWSGLPLAKGWSLADIVIEEREADHQDLLRDIGVREDPPGGA